MSWKPLTLEQAGGFPTYQVLLLSDGGSPVILQTNESLVIVNDLTPGLKYEVQVNAITKGGEGPLLKGKEYIRCVVVCTKYMYCIRIFDCLF